MRERMIMRISTSTTTKAMTRAAAGLAARFLVFE